MQVTETLAEGLKREYKMVIEASEIDAAVEDRLKEMAPTVSLPGFRPGKAPVKILRQRFGKSVMGEAIDQKVRQVVNDTFEDRGLTPAIEPDIDFGEFEEGKDLEFTLKTEIMPEIEPADFSTFELVQLEVQAKDEEIEAELNNLAEAAREATEVTEARPAVDGDILTIDFVGSVDGEEFPGGEADAYDLELGAGSFIPGFEEQLVGASAGDEREVNVTFPEEYGAEHLAGKAAVFKVKVHGLKEKAAPTIDDELAKRVGMEDLATLKTQIAERISKSYEEAARGRTKRELFDKLDEAHTFDAPPTLVEQEFKAIWGQVKEQLEGDNAEEVREGKTDEELEAEYRVLAVRRVRLGLLLAEVGKRNNVQVIVQDISQAIRAQAASFPAQEQMDY
jgi:trigger factor